MSIILEALKKVNKREVDVNAEMTKDISRPELKSPEVQTPKTDDLHLSRPAFIVAVTILCAGLLFSFIFKERDYSAKKPLKSKIETHNLKPTAAANLAVEGYTPPQPIPKRGPAPVTIFNLKPLNPKIRLSGIVYGFGKPTAIIEDKIVEEGQSIKGAKVVKIYSDHVELLNESSGEIFVLKVR